METFTSSEAGPGGAWPEPEVIETLRDDQEVFLVRVRERSGRMVVCKAFGPRPHARERDWLANELRVAATLDPAAVIRALRLDRFGGLEVIVLEDFAGVPLDQLLAGGSLMDPGRFLRIALGAALALVRVHREGVIHKDLKPDNLVVDERVGTVRITGFAIASFLPREQQEPRSPGLIEGTLAYMSPEQTGRMNRAIDRRADLYSLGVTFYQMATGQLPFRSNDPLTAVHFHVARSPVSPAELVPGLPAPLAQVLLKLLAKEPDDRYQSAAGLVHDLARCLEGWEREGRIEPFPLATADQPEFLQLPQRLYGRARELQLLRAALERVVASATSELVLISGEPGVGKSSLVQEVGKEVLREHGRFLAGKFDQWTRGAPYQVIVPALDDLVDELLDLSEEALASWREHLLRSVGANGRLMTELCPRLARLLGEQPPVVELGPTEARMRFEVTLQKLLGAFTSDGRPLVLFLDDLQWADADMVSLAEQLSSGAHAHHLLIVGAYRRDESAASIALQGLVERLRAGGAGTTIELGAIRAEEVAALVGDALHTPADEVGEIGELIHRLTGGNPLFIIQLLSALHRDELIQRERDTGRWRWDLAGIAAKGSTSNVVEFLAAKVRGLRGDTRQVLRLGAVAATMIDVQLLAAYLRRPEGAIEQDLVAAVGEGLVERVDHGYRFAHDRVREAAYQLIPEEERPSVHLRIGRLLRERTPPERLDERVFDIVDQLNRGAALVEEPAERAEVARLNLLAGRQARARNAYAAAIDYFAAGSARLPVDAWQTQYDLTYALHLARAEVELRAGHGDETLALLSRLEANARTKLERAPVTRLAPDAHMARGDVPEAVKSMLDGLALLGVELPRQPTWADVVAERERVERLRAGRPVSALGRLPKLEDPEKAAALRVPAIVLGDRNLYCLVVTRMVALTLEHGLVPESANWYAAYATTLVSAFEDFGQAEEFARLALQLARGSPSFSQVIALWPQVAFWRLPSEEVMQITREAFRVTSEAGDLTRSSFVASAIVLRLLLKGDPLGRVEDEAAALLPLVRVRDVADIITIYRQSARALTGRTRRLGCFDDASFDQAGFEASLGRRIPIVVGWYWVAKLRIAFLAGDHDEARAAADEAARLLATFGGTTASRDFHLYDALVCSVMLGRGEETERWLARLHTHAAKFQRWAEANPAMFQPGLALVRAELAHREGRHHEAARLYEESVQGARAAGLLPEEALALERAAAFHAEQGAQVVAAALTAEAHAAYLRWGAEGKARQLERHDQRLGAASQPFRADATMVVRPEDIDLLSVVKTSQALSGEVLLASLLRTLMQVLLAQGGASRGTLMLARAGELEIVAEAEGDVGAEVAVRQRHGARAGSSASLPQTIIKHAWRTGERIVLDDARGESRFAGDAYLARERSRSVLCMPIRRQAEVVGLLYLENGSLAGTFTPQRIFVLELLAAQAAISLENARFVEEEHAARATAEQARTRATLLADASALLSESLDWRVVLERLAALLARHLGDWCVIELFDEQRIRRAAWAHRDPRRIPALLALRDRHPPTWDSNHPVSVVIRTGAPVFASEPDPASAAAGHSWQPAELGVAAVMCVPLLVRGDVLGAVTLVTEGSRRFQGEDLALAQEIALRAATAVDNGQLYQRTQEAVRLRDEFLSVASHELTTPMAALLPTLEALIGDVPEVREGSPQLRRMISLAERQGRRLNRLIGELLDTTRLTRGAPALQLEGVDLGAMVRDAIERQQPEVTRAGCLVKLDLQPGVHGRWDAGRLEQVVVNLLSNALKFGGGQPIEIRVRGHGATASLAVTDHGIGIAPDRQTRIFERFERGVSAEHYGGLGLGLYIARHIVNAHGGSISVASRPGAGSTFTVTLPADEAPSMVTRDG